MVGLLGTGSLDISAILEKLYGAAIQLTEQRFLALRVCGVGSAGAPRRFSASRHSWT